MHINLFRNEILFSIQLTQNFWNPLRQIFIYLPKNLENAWAKKIGLKIRVQRKISGRMRYNDM